jgi:hypothetical protein
MERMMADCRRFESDSKCQLTIIGPEDDVVAAAGWKSAPSRASQCPPRPGSAQAHPSRRHEA